MSENVDDDDFNVSVGDEEFGIANSTFNSVATLDETLDSSFDVDDPDPVVPVPVSSTPIKKGKGRAGSGFKVPKPPPAKYFKKCPLCGRYIVTERGYKTHEQTHRWKEAVALKPPVQELMQMCRDKAPLVLEKILTEFNVGVDQPGHEFAVQVKSVVGDLKCNIQDSDFLTIVLSLIEGIFSEKSKSKAMPSALRSVLQCELSKIYSHSDLRQKLMDSFMLVTKTSEEMAWNIIFKFVKKMMDAAFISMCEKIRGPILQSNQLLSKDDFDHHLSQQVVHHVSGACLRAHFRNAYAHPNNKYMRNVKECILEKFANIGQPSITDKRNPKYWTALLNRKSLLFLHDPALPFFIAVSKLLQRLEAPDGSLLHSKVMDAVVATPAITTLWDSIVDNSLSDDESFRFMKEVIKSLTNSFGKGVMLRRMNAKTRSGRGNKACLAPGMRARLIGKP